MVKARLLLPVLLLAALACSAVHAVTIGEVKSSYTDGASVFVRGVVTYITPTECYIQRADRSAGIWAEADTTGLVIGDEVYLTGDIATRNSERIIQRTYVIKTGYSSPAKPLAMLNRNLGGAPLGLQPGLDDRRPVRVPSGNGWTQDWQWFPAAGPNNIGLLVKAWGTVKAVSQSATDGTKWFHIDDGSHVISDLGDWGVLVYSDAPVKQGDQVTVTGISSLEPCIDKPEKMIRVLRTRSTDDVQITKQAPVLDPQFSEEFNEPVLGPMWAYDKCCGSISVTSNPGWARLICPEDGDCWPSLSRPIKLNIGDTLSMRIRADFSPSATADQSVSVSLTCSPFADPSSYYDHDYGCVGIVGVGKHPRNGSLVIVGDTWSYLSCSTVDVTVKDGNITVVADNGIATVTGKLMGTNPYLRIRINSDNTNPIGRPFAAYVDYVRITPAN